MKIRRTSDWDACASIQLATCPDDTPETPALGNVFWLACDGKTPAAFASLRPGRTKGTAFLSRAGVLPVYRGLGLQRKLIRARVRWAKKHGYRRVVTYVLPDSSHSLANLLACGFDVYRPKIAWASGTVIYLKKRL